jgi:hypothetical protein
MKKNIKIFGSEFVKNNKNKCKISFENKEYNLVDNFINNGKYNNSTIIMKLIGIKIYH